MPDPVEGLTDVAEDRSNFFPAVHSLTEMMICVYQLKSGGVARYKTRLKRSYYLVGDNVIVQVFMNTGFHSFARLAEKRDMFEVTCTW